MASPAKPAVLVADDDPGLRALLQELLSRNGFTVITAVDGVDAVEKLKANTVQLLVTDLAMPRLNGLQVARKCKAMRPDLPIVLLTAWDLLVEEGDRIENGIDRVVAKPAHASELLQIVRELSSQPTTPGG